MSTTISISTSINQALLDSYTFPVTIDEGTLENPVIITFEEDLIIRSTIGIDGYFIIGSEYITVNGESHTVTIDNIPVYPGLIQNGTDTLTAQSNLRIENIGILSTNETSLANNNYFRKPEFTIKELALEIKIPVSHLKYLYKYHSKISFSDHKKIIRIKDALDLIDQNYLHTHTLESLSKKVGFASYNPFFTSFKEVVGKSPIQYISNSNENLKSS